MTDVHNQTFRFSDAVFAVDCSPKALRKMLESPVLCLPKDESGGWHSFSLLQIALLAVARRLIEFGVSIDDAGAQAAIVVFAPVAKSRAGKITAEKLLALLSTSYAIVTHVDGHRNFRLCQAVHWSQIELDLQDGPALIMHVGPTIQRAFRRAVLGSSEWNNEDSSADLLAAIQKLTITIQDATPDAIAAAGQ